MSLTCISQQYFKNFDYSGGHIDNWHSTTTHSAKCDVISGQNSRIKLISHQQNTIAKKYKRTGIIVLKVLPHHPIKKFIS